MVTGDVRASRVFVLLMSQLIEGKLIVVAENTTRLERELKGK